jgi:hypothetical protein
MDRDFPPAAIATMWRMILSASLTLEQSMTIAAFCKKNSQAPYWLAREYFGTVMPIARFTEEELVVEQVIKSYATIGILPLEQQMEKPWWLRPAGESNQIFIFAKLPYVVQSWMADDENAFAIAAVMPEETGDDISVLAIETFAAADEVIANLQRVYAADILLLSQAENGLLIGVSCFLDSALLAQKTLGSAVRLLGAYARPLQFSEKDSIS